MKEEPINKKLMELAEGKPRKSRENSEDSNISKQVFIKEKSQVKEQQSPPAPPPPPPEPKPRSSLEESLPAAMHTESDLSDISDDPDDILEMEEEIDQNSGKKDVENDKDSSSVKSQEILQPSPKPDDSFSKEKDGSESFG